MKIFTTLLFSLTFIQLFAQKDDKITIPKGVVYNYCKPKIVGKAKVAITNNLSDSTDYSLSQPILFVGPILWNRFKSIDKLNNIFGGNVTFLVDKNKLSGKMTQGLIDAKSIWAELRKEINGNSYIIRKLNEKELQYFWSVISFDIDEPLLIVETKDHKYILNISKSDLTLGWLDEVPF